jgi:uncharacterized protein
MPTIKALTRITLAISAAVLLCMAYGYFIEPERLVVNQYELRIDKWNPAFDGFRAAVISDIHGGSHGATVEKLREIVKRTNEQNVDAIFILGDFLSQKRENGIRGLRMEPAVIADNLAGLQSRHGVFLVLGNHDEWYNPALVIEEFERIGYNVLNGELAEIRISDGGKLRILGLKDHTTLGIWKEYSDAAKRTAAPTNGQGDLIVLQHSPDVVPAITGELRISPDTMVLLAGHTHGGQVRLPLLGSPIVPSMFGQKFVRGHVRDAGIDVFVTTGIGTSIMPFRFLVPPEIAVVTIRSGRP